MTESKIIHEFQKNAFECVRASVSAYQGNEYIDLRIFYKGDDGELYPTKKGLRINADLIVDLQEAVQKLRAAVDPE